MKIAIMTFLLTYLTLPAAYSRECELPHERLSASCAGEETVSAVQKRKKDLKQIVQDYHSKSQKAAETIEVAQAEHERYVSSQKERR